MKNKLLDIANRFATMILPMTLFLVMYDSIGFEYTVVLSIGAVFGLVGLTRKDT